MNETTETTIGEGQQMGERKPLSKKVRFEVFKRDSFTCQYCGISAPNVILQVDHIEPVSKGGTNDIMNLVTACADCNAGKSDRQLNDQSVVKVRQAQAHDVQQSREQLEMLMKWHEGQKQIEDESIAAIHDYFRKVTGRRLRDEGIQKLKAMQKKFGAKAILEAIDIAVEQYVTSSDGQEHADQIENLFRKLPGICWNRQDPINNLCSYCTHNLSKIMGRKWHNMLSRQVHELVRRACRLGLNDDEIKSCVFDARNVDDFEKNIYEIVNAQTDEFERQWAAQ